MFLQLPRKAGFGYIGDYRHAYDHANGDAKEREGADAVVPAALFLEGDGEGFEQEVCDAVDEGEIYSNEHEDGF